MTEAESARASDERMLTDEDRLQQILPLVYDELRRLARAYMRTERTDHTLQPTALVHEAYLRLAEQTSTLWRSRAHFYRVAAQAMRRALVNHAVHHKRIKRGGGRAPVPLDESLIADDRTPRVVDIDEALHRLAQIDERKARVVELRFFGALTAEETAEALGVSVRTVKRQWQMARIWLLHHLSNGENK